MNKKMNNKYLNGESGNINYCNYLDMDVILHNTINKNISYYNIDENKNDSKSTSSIKYLSFTFSANIL